MKTGVLILAAGAASRMQGPKMLLPFSDSTILSSILKEAAAIQPDSMVLVTGHYHQDILSRIDASGLTVVYNAQWQQGMASSIQFGLAELLKTSPHLSAVFILTSDQPFLNGGLLQQMGMVRAETKKGIVAARYGEVTGTPVLFDCRYFDALMQLKGDTGARSILRQNPEDVATVPFPFGEIDIDTPSDYHNLCLQLNPTNA